MIMKIIEVLNGPYRRISVTKKSYFSGKENTMEMIVDQDDFFAWRDGQRIQVAMPYLNADEREFLVTGITVEEWEKHFG